AVALLVLGVGNAVLWRAYVGTARAQGVPPLSRGVLEGFTPWLHVVGHLVPAALATVAWLVPGAAPVLLALSGAAAIAGGAAWKYTVIVRAAYMQGFDLRQLPQRGSGRRAAPTRLDVSAMPRPASSSLHVE